MDFITIKGSKDQCHTLLQFDGGARPNRGATAGAYVLKRDDAMIAEGGRYLTHGTSNMGEYNGLLAGLDRSLELGIKSLLIEGDSLLVISQISGKWKVKDEKMIILCAAVMERLALFRNVAVRHIPRRFNSHADALSDYTLCLGKDWKKK